tara:strand:+ start:36557 stop:36790 length:234 start_codon:yes stop_codon:yes gene_type:complete
MDIINIFGTYSSSDTFQSINRSNLGLTGSWGSYTQFQITEYTEMLDNLQREENLDAILKNRKAKKLILRDLFKKNTY